MIPEEWAAIPCLIAAFAGGALWREIIRVRPPALFGARSTVVARHPPWPVEHLMFGPPTPIELERTGPLVVDIPPAAMGAWAPPADRSRNGTRPQHGQDHARPA